MVVILKNRATKGELTKLAKHFHGYIKVVVDVKEGILAGGTDRHFDQKQILLSRGSKQDSVWGGGVDIETGEIDYNSIINLRPNQDNPSRDILSRKVRLEFDKLIKRLII